MPETKAEVVSVQIISKLSVKTIGCNPKKAAAMDDVPGGPAPSVALCKVYGIASGIKHTEDTRDGKIYTALIGDFEAINLQDGKIYRSGKLYLPAGIQEVIEAPLQAAADHDPPQSIAIRFGFELSSVKSGNPIGYSYQARPLVKPAADDPLMELRQALSGAPQIEAPKQPEAPKLEAPKPPEAPKQPEAARRPDPSGKRR